MVKLRFDLPLRAKLTQLFHPLQAVRALVGVIHRQAALRHGLLSRAFGKVWDASVKAERQKLVFACGIDRLEAEFSREALVGKPCLLLLRAQHAHAGSSLCPRVGKAGFHEPAAAALPSRRSLHPQAVDIKIIFALDRHPRRFQRCILDEHALLRVELAEHMPLLQAFSQPRTLGLDPGMRRFCPDNAAQVLVWKILRCQIDPFSLHMAAPSNCKIVDMYHALLYEFRTRLSSAGARLFS